ncbi:MAG: hypothetical protein PHW02_04720 [bacterium]|nr:hypothetical protein [bacterium]
MKRLILLLLAAVTLISCAKTKVDIEVYSSNVPPGIDEIKLFFESSYEFKIHAKKNILEFDERGYRDISGGVSVTGSMAIQGEGSLEYDHLFDGENWYKRKNLEREVFNQPVDPLNLIENCIIGDLKFISEKNNKLEFEALINVAIVDPLNYSSEGRVLTDKKLQWILIEAKSENLQYTVELEKKMFKPVKIPREVILRCRANASNDDLYALKMRLEESNTGALKNKTAEIYFDEFETFKTFLEEDSITFYEYEYVDPSTEGDDIAFIQGDLRNTVRKLSKKGSFKSRDIEVFSEGRTYEAVLSGMEIISGDKLMLGVGNIAFNAQYEPSTKKIRISGLKKNEMLLLLSLGAYPYKEGGIELNKEE